MTAPSGFRGAFRTDLRAGAASAEGAGIYRILPEAVALPADPSDLETLVRWAAREGHPLVPRGAGSALTGGNVGEGTVVDLTAMRPRVLSVNPETRSARTGAGVAF